MVIWLLYAVGFVYYFFYSFSYFSICMPRYIQVIINNLIKIINNIIFPWVILYIHYFRYTYFIKSCCLFVSSYSNIGGHPLCSHGIYAMCACISIVLPFFISHHFEYYYFYWFNEMNSISGRDSEPSAVIFDHSNMQKFPHSAMFLTHKHYTDTLAVDSSCCNHEIRLFSLWLMGFFSHILWMNFVILVTIAITVSVCEIHKIAISSN